MPNKFSLPNFFASTLKSVIAIDGDTSTIHFFASDKEAKGAFNHNTVVYNAPIFSDEFFDALKNSVKVYREKSTGNSLPTALILPDSAFFTDVIKIPTIQRRALSASLDYATNTIYKNSKELKLNTYLLAQNKINTSFGLVGVKKSLLNKIVSIVESQGISVAQTTFASASMLKGALALNQKLKNINCILVDVKDKITRFAYSVSGKAVGYYSLPFGYSSFSETAINSEPALFDHLAADLLVLNAKEKARKKRLTTLDEVESDDADDESTVDSQNEDLQDEDATIEQDDEVAVTDNGVQKVGALFKRVNRKLPKFMQRPEPQSKEQFVYENFRPILKYTLELVENNYELTSIVPPKTVYVNLPSRYQFLFEQINAECEGNTPLKFVPLVTSDKKDVLDNLELYGGFYIKRFKNQNNF